MNFAENQPKSEHALQEEKPLSGFISYRRDWLRIFLGVPKNPFLPNASSRVIFIGLISFTQCSVWEPNLVSHYLGRDPCIESKAPESQGGAVSITSAAVGIKENSKCYLIFLISNIQWRWIRLLHLPVVLSFRFLPPLWIGPQTQHLFKMIGSWKNANWYFIPHRFFCNGNICGICTLQMKSFFKLAQSLPNKIPYETPLCLLGGSFSQCNV